MEVDIIRYSSQIKSTLGLMFINGKFAAYTLEDAFHVVKIPGETRIPEGRYRIELRTVGSHHIRYKQKFPFHKGMLWITDVPNYTHILIHIGNTDDDTEGCLLIGDSSISNINQAGRIENSTQSYKRVYPLIANAIGKEDVWINYKEWYIEQ